MPMSRAAQVAQLLAFSERASRAGIDHPYHQSLCDLPNMGISIGITTGQVGNQPVSLDLRDRLGWIWTLGHGFSRGAIGWAGGPRAAPDHSRESAAHSCAVRIKERGCHQPGRATFAQNLNLNCKPFSDFVGRDKTHGNGLPCEM